MEEGNIHERWFNAVPDCCVVLTPGFRIIGANDAFAHAAGASREELLGQSWFDALPANPEQPTAAQLQLELRDSIDRVLQTRAPHCLPTRRYDLRAPNSSPPTFELHYFTVKSTPLLGPDGEVEAILQTLDDVTSAVLSGEQERRALATYKELQRRAESGYAQLLDAIPDPIIVFGQDDLIRYVNGRAEEILGHPRSELLGRPMAQLVPAPLREMYHREVAEFLAAPYARAAGSGQQLYAVRQDGSEIPVDVSFAPLQSEDELLIVAAARDMTEKRGSEAAQRLLAERLGNAVASMREAFALYDASDALVLCNAAYRDMVAGAVPGANHRELRSRLMERSLEPHEGFPWPLEPSARPSTGTSVEFTTVDGRWLRMLTERTSDGGTAEVVWDLTADAQRSEELRVARAEAEAASAAKSDFMSSMSHELRTPMNAIMGFAQLSLRDKREPLSDRHREWIELVLQGGAHLLHLIDDVLDFSRIESGRIAIKLDPVSLTELLATVTRTLLPLSTPQRISIATEPLPPALPRVTADKVRLKQILINLASNAIKYNVPGGSVRFRVSLVGAGQLRVSVQDTGIGVPLEKQARLFEPFHRAGQEGGPIQGTGIGLAISRRLAHLMGGQTGFQSEPGVGSTFWVELPIAAEHASVPPAAPLHTSASTLARHDGKLVLYVEDNAANVAFMHGVFELVPNVRLLVAPNAESGLLRASAEHPDLVVMDLNLPGMNGVAALRALRSSSLTREVPVMALTASASSKSREDGLQAGFDAYLTKPIDVDSFLYLVDQLLSRSADPTAD